MIHGICLQRVGLGLSDARRYADALPWHERALEHASRGDDQGRVNHSALGTSRHDVGFCLVKRGKSAEALPWYQRGVHGAAAG